jgi:hypothetical protein
MSRGNGDNRLNGLDRPATPRTSLFWVSQGLTETKPPAKLSKSL